jgi:hypothetical protein
MRLFFRNKKLIRLWRSKLIIFKLACLPLHLMKEKVVSPQTKFVFLLPYCCCELLLIKTVILLILILVDIELQGVDFSDLL